MDCSTPGSSVFHYLPDGILNSFFLLKKKQDAETMPLLFEPLFKHTQATKMGYSFQRIVIHLAGNEPF